MSMVGKRLRYTGIYKLIIVLAVFYMFTAKDIVQAQEAQVIYDFIEITEDMPAYESPDYESKMDMVIPKGESVLVISQTAEGWYQILYHEKFLYINSQNGSVEEAEIPEEVVEEIEENKTRQAPTQEEIELVLKSADASENNESAEKLPRILLGVVTLVVLLSGIGYLYLNRKEQVEEAKKRKRAEVSGNGRKSNQ